MMVRAIMRTTSVWNLEALVPRLELVCTTHKNVFQPLLGQKLNGIGVEQRRERVAWQLGRCWEYIRCSRTALTNGQERATQLTPTPVPTYSWQGGDRDRPGGRRGGSSHRAQYQQRQRRRRASGPKRA